MKTGHPVLAMPSHRRWIDAIELTTVAYVIHGKTTRAGRQMAHNTLLASMFWSLERTVSDDLHRFSLHGERQAWPQPRPATALLLLEAAQPARPTHSRRHADYSYNFSASAEPCGISQQSVYRRLRWRRASAGLPVFWNACGGKVVLTDSASRDEVMPLIAQERVLTLPSSALAHDGRPGGERQRPPLLRVIQEAAH